MNAQYDGIFSPNPLRRPNPSLYGEFNCLEYRHLSSALEASS
jgi:hypothetical protein